jgi:hypothetical protein
MLTNLLAGPGSLPFNIGLLVFAAAAAVLGNKIAGDDRRERAAAKAETYCELTRFEVFRYVLAAKLNAARVAR